jgi:hypothetical protein
VFCLTHPHTFDVYNFLPQVLNHHSHSLVLPLQRQNFSPEVHRRLEGFDFFLAEILQQHCECSKLLHYILTSMILLIPSTSFLHIKTASSKSSKVPVKGISISPRGRTICMSLSHIMCISSFLMWVSSACILAPLSFLWDNLLWKCDEVVSASVTSVWAAFNYKNWFRRRVVFYLDWLL